MPSAMPSAASSKHFMPRLGFDLRTSIRFSIRQILTWLKQNNRQTARKVKELRLSRRRHLFRLKKKKKKTKKPLQNPHQARNLLASLKISTWKSDILICGNIPVSHGHKQAHVCTYMHVYVCVCEHVCMYRYVCVSCFFFLLTRAKCVSHAAFSLPKLLFRVVCV